MRYHHVLLPALAGLAFAQDQAADADTPRATPDALPIDDLRDIPVPTYTVATGVKEQDIPYATAAAIADVFSAMAATPLSVVPAATNVPLNSAGTNGGSTDADSSLITSTGSKLKRALTGMARQPLRKRASCDPQPTLDNKYNVKLDTPDNFNNDPTIASIANNANAAPNGYYQNFKNLAAANSAMNYLGYSVVPNGRGYDVDWCAAKCDAKEGCLSFNIYFERDPTIDPGPGCPNPAGFANIKCSFWGTGLDASTATNVGQWREKFWVSIAGSNAYTSYKLGGPVDGWNGPQKLDKKALNAPLWDCENKWSYLGYKLLQAGSVDPRLCSAACDALTAFNAAHPANADPYACNAFGSYILTKKNSTGSYQQGQMCTFYTAYWDAKYATNSGASDPSIGATYSYSYSSFYGKKNTQPNCGSDYVSPSGTFIKGGVDKKAAIKQAVQTISASSLQPYCSSILGYTPLIASATTTTTFTPQATVTSTSTATEEQDSTVTVTSTAVVKAKRDVEASSTTIGGIVVPFTTISGNVGPALPTMPANISATVEKRAVTQPSALSAFPADIVTSACSSAVSQATSTSTVFSTVTATADTSFATSNVATTTTVSSTVSVTTVVTSTAAACTGLSNLIVASGPHAGKAVGSQFPSDVHFMDYSLNLFVDASAAAQWTLREDGTVYGGDNKFALSTHKFANLYWALSLSDFSRDYYAGLQNMYCSVDTSKKSISGAAGVLVCKKADNQPALRFVSCDFPGLTDTLFTWDSTVGDTALSYFCQDLDLAVVPVSTTC